MRKIELNLYADFIFRNELPEEIMTAMHENAEVRQSEDGIIICAFTEEKKAFEFHHICANHGFICEFHETEDNGNVTEVRLMNKIVIKSELKEFTALTVVREGDTITINIVDQKKPIKEEPYPYFVKKDQIFNFDIAQDKDLN